MPTLSPEQASLAREITLSDFTFAHPLAIGILAVRARADQVLLKDLTGELSTFLSRMDFYKYVNIDDPHSVRKRQDVDRTIEIRVADASDDVVFDRLRSLLRRDKSLSTIEKTLIELIGNVENHAEAEGIVLGQVAKDKIRLAVVDSGIGIHRSLTGAAEYSHLTEQEALRRCMEKGVTNGRGRGIGLWSAYEVLKANGGNLVLGSGKYQFDLSCDTVRAAANWIGTYVELTYDLTRPVDYSQITGYGSSLKESDDEFDIPI